MIYSENGQLQWRAYLQSAGGSAYLYTKDSESERRAVEVLTEAMRDKQYGIESILTKRELGAMLASSKVNYAVEARAGFSFDDSVKYPTVEDLAALGTTYATHGYSPDKPGYKCVFIASGPGMTKDKPLGPMEMVDVAPTLAKILGLHFSDCDGRAHCLV